jgi:hypothetical protein
MFHVGAVDELAEATAVPTAALLAGACALPYNSLRRSRPDVRRAHPPVATKESA